MATEVLVAEDDAKLAEVVRRYLENEGYQVVITEDGRSALLRVKRQPPDLVVLDLMLPGLSGWDVCRELRLISDLPVLVLTARSANEDVVLGLDLGADDYVTKPFSPPELMARVRTLLRRHRPGGPDRQILRLGRVSLDRDRHQVEVGGTQVACTPGEFRLLEVLLSRPGRVFSRGQLLDHLHGVASFVSERTVDSHVKNLRKKLERDPVRPELLLTVYGIGYKANEEVRG